MKTAKKRTIPPKLAVKAQLRQAVAWLKKATLEERVQVMVKAGILSEEEAVAALQKAMAPQHRDE